MCVHMCYVFCMIYIHFTKPCCQQLIDRWTFEIGMLLIHLVPIDGIRLNSKRLMEESSKEDFVNFLDLVVYRFHTWTPCWLIFPISCPELWKLRLPSQAAVNKKFHVFSVKSIISSVTHISVGGWTSPMAEKLQKILRPSPTNFRSVACFH